jgi:hypothetical protein
MHGEIRQNGNFQLCAHFLNSVGWRWGSQIPPVFPFAECAEMTRPNSVSNLLFRQTGGFPA